MNLSIRLLITVSLLLSVTSCGRGRSQAVVQATSTPSTATAANTDTITETTATPTVEAEPVAATYDRRALLMQLVDSAILPQVAELVTAAQSLADAAEALAAEPNLKSLTAAQAQWNATAEAWAATEPFDLRFALLVSSKIKKWPIKIVFVEENIAGDEPIDDAFIDAIGSTAKGLATLEYLLFAADETDKGDADALLTALTTNPQRMAYVVALAHNLANAAEELQWMWSAEGDNQGQAFIDADFSGNNVQGSISMITNEMIALLEEVVRTKLDLPLHGVDGTPQPESVESPYADHSIPLIIANLRGSQAIFAAGLADYVNFLQGEDQLSTAIDAQFEAAIAALAALDRPLQIAVVEEPAALQAARDEVRALLVLFKVDLANQLSITVTFSDSDGD